MTNEVRLRFSGSFGDGLEFVEAENADGESIDVGEWERDGGDHILSLDPEELV